jgi:serine/threonine-protein phosphatase CPPED1
MTRMEKTGFQHVDQPEITLSGVRKIVLLGDPGCTRFTEDSRKILGRILDQEADLFFMLGDLVFSDSEDEFRELITFCDSRVKAPVFALRGNHDLSHYSKFLGLGSYALAFDRHVCFFMDDATGHFLPADLALLREVLEKHQEKEFFVFLHIPPPTHVDRRGLKKEDWEKLKAVLDPYRERIGHIFCGHIHGFHEYEIDGYPVTITAGGGAAMIHELLPPAQKLHHSVVLSLRPEGSYSVETIPVVAEAV